MADSKSTSMLVALVLCALAGGAAWWGARNRTSNGTSSPSSSSAAGSPQEEDAAAPVSRERFVVTPPADPGRTTFRLAGCSDDEPSPRGVSFDEAVRLVQGELWDRALVVLRGDDASDELRLGMRELFTRQGDALAGIAALERASDRLDGDYDHARAAAFCVALRTDDDAAPALARLESYGSSPLVHLAHATRARIRRDRDAEHDALVRAFEADPEQPGVALAVTVHAMREGDPVRALQGLESYSWLEPGDPWIAFAQGRLRQRAALVAEMTIAERHGVTLVHQASAADARRVHLSVLRALDEAAEMLSVPRRPRLRVVLYRDAEDYRRATCGPGWSRASFDGALRIPGSLLNTRHEERTLRHETFHAQLAHAAPSSPLWLHEGGAQLFEGTVPEGVRRTLGVIATHESYVPFPSLEGSFMVIDDAQSARFAYHQSYAMVAASTEQDPRALARATAHLAAGGEPSALLAAMNDRPLTGDALVRWARTAVAE